jgi:hypothetical protein
VVSLDKADAVIDVFNDIPASFVQKRDYFELLPAAKSRELTEKASQ